MLRGRLGVVLLMFRIRAHVVGRAIRMGMVPSGTNAREQTRQVDFEWMRAALQKDISSEALKHEIGDIPDLPTLFHRLYEGRLSDRARSMVVLAKHLERAVKRFALPRHKLSDPP